MLTRNAVTNVRGDAEERHPTEDRPTTTKIGTTATSEACLPAFEAVHRGEGGRHAAKGKQHRLMTGATQLSTCANMLGDER